MNGFAQIPKGVTGTCDNVFNFSQDPGNRVTHSISLKGPYNGNFDLVTKPGIRSWSPCGGSTAILNMNTQCAINPTNKEALIAVRFLPYLQAFAKYLTLKFSRSTTSAAWSRSSLPSSGRSASAANRTPVLVNSATGVALDLLGSLCNI